MTKTNDAILRRGAKLPLALVRRTVVRPSSGRQPSCIDVLIRIPIDEEGFGALPFLAVAQSDGGGVAIKLGKTHATKEAIAAVRRP